jgi:hypothetical protein
MTMQNTAVGPEDPHPDYTANMPERGF